MKWASSLLAVMVVASTGFAQATLQQPVALTEPVPATADMFSPSPSCSDALDGGIQGGWLTSDRAFPNFIGFVSNPTFSIDPRALTQIWPVFANTWTQKFGPIDSGDIQAYGPGISFAFSDRFEVGLNRGAYAVANVDKFRDGFLNLGGFAQYTLIRDVPNQFLLSAGLMVEAPTGEADVLSGHGPAYLTPYLTFGKEFGEFHVLGTTGYNFPTEASRTTIDTYYANLHLDVRLFGWLYPLVEFNGAWISTNLDLRHPELLSLADLPHFFDLDRHDVTGGIVTIAPGFNAVLIHDRLEAGIVYERPIWSQHGYRFDEVLLKLILRF
jgi:hypothetical protein